MSTTTHPDTDDDLEAAVREYLRQRVEQGNTYVRSKNIVRTLDRPDVVDGRSLWPIMAALQRAGDVEPADRSTTGSTLYRINTSRFDT